MISYYAGPDKYDPACSITRCNHQQVHPPTIIARPSFNEYYLTYNNDGCHFIKNKFKASRKKGLNPFATRFSQAAHYIPNKCNLCSYAIITGKHDESINMSYLRWKDPLFQGMFIIPKLRDSIKGKRYSKFFVVPREQYMFFKKEHKMGISTKTGEKDPVEYFDSNVSTFLSNHLTRLYNFGVPHIFTSYLFIMTR